LISSLTEKISSYTKLAELIFFPSFCELCSSLLESPRERVICHSCWKSIRTSYHSYCLCCGRFFEALEESRLCQACLEKRPSFSHHRSCGKYKGKLRDIILLYKYRKFKVLGKDLAHFVDRALGREEEIWWKVDAIIPVPLHPKRKKERGFNQAQIIGKELARMKGIELRDQLLVKTKNVPPQTSLRVEERAENVSGAFAIADRGKIKGKVVLLVDDVYTTGSTIRECSSVLKKDGVKEVRALTVAQA
jgi:competence protein ComFC